VFSSEVFSEFSLVSGVAEHGTLKTPPFPVLLEKAETVETQCASTVPEIFNLS
jgi:hypothetical protein